MEFETSDQFEKSMTKVYGIFCQLRERRPETYREDFGAVMDALHDEGPDAANALVVALLGAVT